MKRWIFSNALACRPKDCFYLCYFVVFDIFKLSIVPKHGKIKLYFTLLLLTLLPTIKVDYALIILVISVGECLLLNNFNSLEKVNIETHKIAVQNENLPVKVSTKKAIKKIVKVRIKVTVV